MKISLVKIGKQNFTIKHDEAGNAPKIHTVDIHVIAAT